MYKVGIIGFGVVGKGVANLLGEYVVAIYDPNVEVVDEAEKIEINDKDSFKGLDLAVICVPTPTSENGAANVEIVEDSCLWLDKINFKGVVLIKSTTPPSELARLRQKYGLRLVFSPEYMGESKYYTPPWNYPDPSDMRSHTWQTFGGEKKDTSLCIDIFKRKMGVDCKFYQTDLVTASLAKYMENSFFATKVTFVNEWFDICKAYGVNWNELRELWLADPRINRNHTLVFPKDRGYGGKCFPKDVKAIIADSEKIDYSATLMKCVDAVNKFFRGEKRKEEVKLEKDNIFNE